MAASVIERAVIQLGLEVKPASKKQFADFDKSLDAVFKGVTKLTAAFAGLIATITGATIVTNKETTKLDNLAKSVGSNLQVVQALTDEIGAAGFQSEQLISLMEEVNNKIGEKKGLGKMTAVEESTRMLGLRFQELKKLKPEEQFIKILDAAKKMEDQQKAVSAVDMIMGGEANRILGHLRNVDGSLTEIIAKRLELNFLSQEGIDGAKRWSRSLGFVTSAVRSMWQQFSGLTGDVLQPMLESFQAWVRANRNLIKSKMKEWAESFGKAVEWLTPKIIWLVTKAKQLWEWLAKVVENMGGFENAMKLLGAAIAAMGILKAIRLIQQFGQAAVNAQLKLFAWVAIIAAVILLLDDLWTFLEDPEADTMIGRVLKKFEEWLGLDIVGPIREAWPKIKAFTINLGQAFIQLFNIVFETVASIALFIADIFKIGIGDAWDKLVVRLGNSWRALWPEAVKFFNDYFLTPITDAFEWIEDKISSIPFLSKANEQASDIPSGIGGFFSRASDQASGLLGGLFDSGTGANSAAGATTNNQSGGDTTNMSVNVTANTGASPTDIMQTVRNGFEEMMAETVNDTSTMVER